MNTINKGVRKVVIALIGFPLLAAGLLLIPLPGPGLVVCFAALLLLSSEFSWAEKYYLKTKRAIGKVIADTKAKQQKILDKAEDTDTKQK